MQDLKAVQQFVKEAGGDGHTLFYPKFFTDMGFDSEFVNKFTHEHESDGSHKGSIYKDGKRVEKVAGVYVLDFAYGVAYDIGADTGPANRKMGRGFQAQELAVAINNRLKELI